MSKKKVELQEKEVVDLINKELTEEKNKKRLLKISEKALSIFNQLDLEKAIEEFLRSDVVVQKYRLEKANIDNLKSRFLEETKRYIDAFSKERVESTFFIKVVGFIVEEFKEKYENKRLGEKEITEAISGILKKYEKANKKDFEYELATFWENILGLVVTSQIEREKQEEIEKLKQKIEKLKAENKDLKEAYARMKNDYASLRRRTEEEKKMFQENSEREILKELVELADDFERALEQIEKAENPELFKGIQIIGKKFLQFLEKKGVEKVGKVGEEFDHNYHEALFVEEAEEENKILEIIRNGYLHKGKLLRPAGVKVSVKRKSKEEEK